jgi:hypothetical protein
MCEKTGMYILLQIQSGFDFVCSSTGRIKDVLKIVVCLFFAAMEVCSLTIFIIVRVNQ